MFAEEARLRKRKRTEEYRMAREKREARRLEPRLQFLGHTHTGARSLAGESALICLLIWRSHTYGRSLERRLEKSKERQRRWGAAGVRARTRWARR